MKDKVKLHKLKVADVPMKPAPGAKDYYYPVIPVNWTQELDKPRSGWMVWLSPVAVALMIGILFGSLELLSSFMDKKTAVLFALIITCIYTALVIALALLLDRKEVKVYKLREGLANENVKGFVSWLKARYNIVYDPTAERDKNWLHEVVSYGYVGDRATFKDAYGNQFVLEKHRWKLRVMDMKTLKEKAVVKENRRQRWL